MGGGGGGEGGQRRGPGLAIEDARQVSNARTNIYIQHTRHPDKKMASGGGGGGGGSGGSTPANNNSNAAVAVSPIPAVPVELTALRTTSGLGGQGDSSNQSTVYVEAADPVGGGVGNVPGTAGGLQLTTITVAVPAPLSPSDPALLHAVNMPQLPTVPTAVALPTVPVATAASNQDCTFKWKYEQNKNDKTNSGGGGSGGGGTSLVSD